MNKEKYSDFIETLKDALDSLKKQADLEKDFEYIISRVCTKKSDGIVECDIYPFLGKKPDESKKAAVLGILKIVYGEDAYKHESLVDLFDSSKKDLLVPITINSNDELIEFCIKAGNIINNPLYNPKERKAYGTIMKGIQTGIAKSMVILDKRKIKVSICLDTLKLILNAVNRSIEIEIKNPDLFYSCLDEILYVIGEEKEQFSGLLRPFIEEYNKDIKKDAYDKMIFKYYSRIEKSCNGNLKNIYKVMPKYTDPDFYTKMDDLEQLFDEKNPSCTSKAAAFMGLHRYRKVREDMKEGKSIC